MPRRALVTLPDGVWKLIDEQFKGKIGDGDSEVIRNIVMGYLMEKGYPFDTKKTHKTQSVSIEQIATELDIQEKMIDSLAEILEEKGIIKYNQWEKRTQSKLHLKVQTNRYYYNPMHTTTKK